MELWGGVKKTMYLIKQAQRAGGMKGVSTTPQVFPETMKRETKKLGGTIFNRVQNHPREVRKL